jgi:serine/threonine protein kinase
VISQNNKTISNFMINDNGRLVLNDLAMSFKIPPSGIVNHIGRFGTSCYLVPEVYQKRPFHAKQCDLWACTISLFNILTSQRMYTFPVRRDLIFRYCIVAKGLSTTQKHTKNVFNKKIQEMILSSSTSTHELNELLSIFEKSLLMSDELLELFEKTLDYDPSKRWTTEQVVQSPWYNMTNTKNNNNNNNNT